jgi:phosphoserine aminotransferase
MEQKRAHNFNAGPSGLPVSVLQQAQAELLDFRGTGMSVMEISHRSKEFEAVIQTAETDLRELMKSQTTNPVSAGCRLQFSMIPMNLGLQVSQRLHVTGTWSKTAIKDGTKARDSEIAAS